MPSTLNGRKVSGATQTSQLSKISLSSKLFSSETWKKSAVSTKARRANKAALALRELILDPTATATCEIEHEETRSAVPEKDDNAPKRPVRSRAKTISVQQGVGKSRYPLEYEPQAKPQDDGSKHEESTSNTHTQKGENKKVSEIAVESKYKTWTRRTSSNFAQGSIFNIYKSTSSSSSSSRTTVPRLREKDVERLRTQLLKPDQAGLVIASARILETPSIDSGYKSRVRTGVEPMRAVCLDCIEDEAETLIKKAKKSQKSRMEDEKRMGEHKFSTLKVSPISPPRLPVLLSLLNGGHIKNHRNDRFKGKTTQTASRAVTKPCCTPALGEGELVKGKVTAKTKLEQDLKHNAECTERTADRDAQAEKVDLANRMGLGTLVAEMMTNAISVAIDDEETPVDINCPSTINGITTTSENFSPAVRPLVPRQEAQATEISILEDPELLPVPGDELLPFGLLLPPSAMSLHRPLAGALPTPETLRLGFDALLNAENKIYTYQGPSHEGIHPPMDRMSIYTYWWGFELAMPPPTLEFLSGCKQISTSLLNLLGVIVYAVPGGTRELAPFAGVLSRFIEAEWKALKAHDKGRGVVCGATWFIPAALVARPWDFDDSNSSTHLDES